MEAARDHQPRVQRSTTSIHPPHPTTSSLVPALVEKQPCHTVRDILPSLLDNTTTQFQKKLTADRLGKRNTSRPVFTSYERNLARAAWGSSTARLARESFLRFASCGLCLEPAIDPVACIHGDIFCRECALSNILAQKKEIKRAEKAREQQGREAQEEQARRDLEAQERAVREFELTQAGLSTQPNGAATGAAESPARDTTSTAEPEQRAKKRKFSLDEDELVRIATDERAKARKAIDDEKVRSLCLSGA